MIKIRDRVYLGILAGGLGNIVKTAIDEISLRKKVSQRSFRSTAAGVWVSNNKQAESLKGQLLGEMLDFGMGIMGAVSMTNFLSKTGKDHLLSKGLLYGMGMGSVITAVLSGLPKNKVNPKDAASNLSYMFSHAAYGLVTIYAISYFGHPSLFDAKPVNNYLQPTETTTEQNTLLNNKTNRKYVQDVTPLN